MLFAHEETRDTFMRDDLRQPTQKKNYDRYSSGIFATGTQDDGLIDTKRQNLLMWSPEQHLNIPIPGKWIRS